MLKVFRASDEELENVMSFVEEELENIGASMKASMQISVAVEEIFVNVAHYAYCGKSGDVSVSLDEDGDSVKIVFSDSGIPFDPLEKSDPDITLSADERQIGGLGIFMVKKSMDSVSYERQGEKNILTMVKKVR